MFYFRYRLRGVTRREARLIFLAVDATMMRLLGLCLSSSALWPAVYDVSSIFAKDARMSFGRGTLIDNFVLFVSAVPPRASRLGFDGEI